MVIGSNGQFGHRQCTSFATSGIPHGKVTELQKVDDGENSHRDSHDRPAPTSPQSNFTFGSIDRPKQTTDVSRQGTEEIVYTNLTDLTDKQLEPEHGGAPASNHEVKDEYYI